MLDIKYCRELLKEEKYSEIYTLFETEYIEVFKKILKVKEDITLIKLLLDMEEEFPEYAGTFKVIAEAFFNERLLKAEKISFLFDTYPEVLEMAKKNK